jgi:hypothetical protein
VRVEAGNVTATPRDLNSIPGYGGDYRTLDKLFDGTNVTTDDRHMWLIQFNKGLSHTIVISLPTATRLKSLKFYNYNKSLEDTYRGVKLVTISVDGKLVTPMRGVVIRKAPGVAFFDFGYTVRLPHTREWEADEIAVYNQPSFGLAPRAQEYVVPIYPTGFVFEFILYSTYGDLHYIGLNGLEMYDILGRPLLQTSPRRVEYQITANPSSVNTLEGMKNDIRTVDKLVDGMNDTADDRHMWLAPLRNTKLYAVTNREVSKTPNVVIVTFNAQVAIAAIKLWNYTKTPTRGVQEYAVFCDNRIVYRVRLEKETLGRHEEGFGAAGAQWCDDDSLRF